MSVEFQDPATGVWPGIETVPDEREIADLGFVPETSIVDEGGGRAGIGTREDEAAGCEDGAEGVEVVLIHCLVRPHGIGMVGDLASEGEIAVAPLLR